MKKVAIMQPYLFPYIGYFQLIKAVDLFIVYDDVQWIKGGWINRNRVLSLEGVSYVTLPVKKDSFSKQIKERVFADNIEAEKHKLLNDLTSVYKDAPYFIQTMKLIESCLSSEDNNVASFIVQSLVNICEYLGISTEIIYSSTLDKKANLKSQERVININEQVGANWYINPIGGQELYDRGTFSSHGIDLYFIKTNPINYKQINEEYIPNLSIIDVMMFNSRQEINNMLINYELI